MTNVYFDEAGFTGNNLLDKHQKYFCIASHNLSELESKNLLRKSFPKYKGGEYKFQIINRRNKSKDDFERFSNYLELSLASKNKYVVVNATDKNFAVFTKFVDYFIEPMFKNIGHDFYGDGYSKKYANYNYGVFLRHHKEILNKIIEEHHNFSRNPNPKTLNALTIFLLSQSANTSLHEDAVRFLRISAMSAFSFNKIYTYTELKGSNEIQLTSMISSVIIWRNLFNDELCVIHDQSSNFFRSMDKWRNFTSPFVNRQDIKTGSGYVVSFPLSVSQTSSVESSESFGVQLSDILAGLFYKELSEKGADENGMVAGGGTLFNNKNIIFDGLIHRDETFNPGMPPKRHGSDSLEKFSKIIFP